MTMGHATAPRHPAPKPPTAQPAGGGSLSAALERVEAQSGSNHPLTREYLAWREALPLETLNDVLSGLAERCVPEDVVTEEDLAACLERLDAADRPDLVAEFCDPLIGRAICRLAGLDLDAALPLGELTGALAALERDRMTSRALRDAEAALAEADRLAARDAPRPAALDGFPAEVPYGTSLALLIAACHAAAQPLAAVIWGLAISGQEIWTAASDEDWATQRFAPLYDRVMSLFRRDPADLEDLPALARIGDDGPLGPHVRALIRQAIPALTNRFPRLYIHRSQVRFLDRRAVIAPFCIPGDAHSRSTVTSSYVIEIRDYALARQIATDNEHFENSRIVEFFKRMQSETQINLESSIQLAENALFFMVGPRHQRSRKVIMDILGQNRLRAWQPVIDQGIDDALETLAAAQSPDIVRDFTEPVLYNICKPLLGLNPADDARFDSVALTLTTIQMPIRSVKALKALELAVHDMMEMIETQPSDDRPGIPRSVLSQLLESDLEGFDRRDLIAFVLVLYSGCINIAHTLANTICWISLLPREMTEGIEDPRWARERIELIMSTCASLNYVRRAAQTDLRIGGLDFTPNHEARIEIAAVNRGVAAGNMTFGHGLRRCVGAALARLVVRAAIPKLYSRFPDLEILPQPLIYEDLVTSTSLETLKCWLHTQTTDRT